MATFALPDIEDAKQIITSRPNVKDAPSALGISEDAFGAFFSSIIESNFYRSQNAFDIARRSLWRLTNVPANWNLGDSDVPDVAAISRAEAVLRTLKDKLLLPHEIGPSAESGTFFGFRGTDTKRAAIECLNDGEAYAILYDDRDFCRTLMIHGDNGNLEDVVNSVANYIREQTIAAGERRG
jgi:hypothetical protein